MSKIRHAFRSRELFVHDGASMRRVHISSKIQMTGAALSVFVAIGAVLSLVQLVASSVQFGHSTANFASRQAEIIAMESKVASLTADVAAVKASAREHADRLEARQAFLAAVMKGEGDPAKLAALLPAGMAAPKDNTREIAAAFAKLNQDQLAMVADLRRALDARYQSTAGELARFGFAADRVAGFDRQAMGGPFEPAPIDAQPVPVAAGADPNFRALFDSWKRLDQLQTGMVAIPSTRPVLLDVQVNSNFGVRADPFNGQRAMHAGVDIAGPHGTPIYATADAIVGRTGWIGGYGNMVELEHGRGIQTRYGHLSQILVQPGTRVKRGEMIALMGSTGRSTGNHLHYEVRIDGKAVSPMPFLQGTEYLLAMQQRRTAAPVAMGGPAETGGK